MKVEQIEKYSFSKMPNPDNRIFSLNNDNSNALYVVWLFLVTKNGFLKDIDSIITGNGQATFVDIEALSNASRLSTDTITKIFQAYADPSVLQSTRDSFKAVASAFQNLADSLSATEYRPDQYGDSGNIYQVCKNGVAVDPEAE